MTEAMPFLQKYDITFLRPPAIGQGIFLREKDSGSPTRDTLSLPSNVAALNSEIPR